MVPLPHLILLYTFNQYFFQTKSLENSCTSGRWSFPGRGGGDKEGGKGEENVSLPASQGTVRVAGLWAALYGLC